jgi:3-phenylpropionate/trans-cinnamate dioxygenase ferredoxin subunit
MSARYVVAKVEDVVPGQGTLVTVKGREIGLYNVGGEYFALLNRCPHEGASLCKGKVIGLVTSDGPGNYKVSRQGEILKCPWHGWEFDIKTGQSYCDPKGTFVKAYKVEVEPGEEVAKGPFVAETFPVTVEDNYLVIEV